MPTGLAAAGVLLSGLAVALFGKRLGSPERHWLLGIAALAPAWFVSLLVFLTKLESADKEVRVYLAGASAAALLGVIGTEYCVRYLQSRSWVRQRVMFWLLGIAALVPSWIVLLRGIAAS